MNSFPLKFDFRHYHRPFRQPLKTHHRTWAMRDGIIVRLEDNQGHRGYGEIAPIPEFGSETSADALQLCRQLRDQQLEPPAFERLEAATPDHPASQFGLMSAWESLQNHAQSIPFGPLAHLNIAQLTYAGLLPSGTAALEAWPLLVQSGYRILKWKIGMAAPEQELQWLQALGKAIPSHVQLRLDANGGLDLPTMHQFLQVCDRLPVEFLEQPLPPSEFPVMLAATQQYRTTLALDESVASLAQLQQCVAAGWPGIYVIKPGIIGSPRRLRSFVQLYDLDLVFSSVFETAIGRLAALQLAAELQTQRALGFGTQHLFKASALDATDYERLWNALSPY